jgi:hypothetical protein
VAAFVAVESKNVFTGGLARASLATTDVNPALKSVDRSMAYIR